MQCDASFVRRVWVAVCSRAYFVRRPLIRATRKLRTGKELGVGAAGSFIHRSGAKAQRVEIL